MVDEITPAGMPALGLIKAKTSNYGGHPPEFWAERITEKLVHISEDQEPDIRQQAEAYREVIREVCLIYIENAIKSYKATLIQELISAGEEKIAEIIKRI